MKSVFVLFLKVSPQDDFFLGQKRGFASRRPPPPPVAETFLFPELINSVRTSRAGLPAREFVSFLLAHQHHQHSSMNTPC